MNQRLPAYTAFFLLGSIMWFSVGLRAQTMAKGTTNLSATIKGVSNPFVLHNELSIRARVWWANYDTSVDDDGGPNGTFDFIAVGSDTNGPFGYQPVTRLYGNSGSGEIQLLPDQLAGVDATQSAKSGAWFDLDNDGRPDFIVSGSTNDLNSDPAIVLWRNTPDGFVQVPAAFPSLWDASIVPGDFNNDGRVDLLIAGTPSCYCAVPVMQLWTHVEDGSFSNVPIALAGLSGQAIATGDFDKDGFLDIALNGYSGSNYVTQVWRNDRNANFTLSNELLPGFGGILNAADFDNDGWLDLLAGGNTLNPVLDEEDVEIFAHVFRNNHDGTFSRAIDIRNLKPRSAAVGDYDNDGYLDLVVNGYDESLENHEGKNVTRILRNVDGSAFTNVQSFLERNSSSLAWVDFDGDGKLDVSSSGRWKEFWQFELFRNTSPTGNAPPGAPTNLTATLVSNGVWLSWSPATDDHTPQAALTYNVRVTAGGPGYGVPVSPLSDVEGHRRVPEPGNAGQRTNYFIRLPVPHESGASARYYWNVQAVDGAFSGGSFAGGGDSIIFLHSAPQFYSIRRLSNGNISLAVAGSPSWWASGAYRIESSDDLVTWNDRGPIFNVLCCSYRFEDTTSSNAPMRFYRVRYP